MKGPDPIHAYVAELSARLERHGHAARRSLQEEEDHLRDSTASYCADGIPEATAAYIEEVRNLAMLVASDRTGRPQSELCCCFDISMPSISRTISIRP